MVREFAMDFVLPQPAGIGGNQPSVTDDDRGAPGQSEIKMTALAPPVTPCYAPCTSSNSACMKPFYWRDLDL